MAMASGPTLVLPNGKLALRYPTLMPAAWAEMAVPLVERADDGVIP